MADNLSFPVFQTSGDIKEEKSEKKKLHKLPL